MSLGFGSSSSSSSTTQSPTDPEAARRMAAVAERQQAMAEEQWGIGKETYMPYEKAMVGSNTKLIQPNEEYMGKYLEQGIADIEGNEPLKTRIREQVMNDLTSSSAVPGEFYSKVLEGPKTEEKMATAGADVAQAFKNIEGEQRRGMGRMGLDPTSGAYASQRGKTLRSKAKALAGAKTSARRTAEQDYFDQLMAGMNARSGSMGSVPLTAGTEGALQLGGYQMSNPLDRSSSIYSNVIAANAAGMKPLTQSQGSSKSWNFSGGY